MHNDGSKRVLFGSNWPMIAPARCLRDLQSLGLTNEQKRNFLHDNAVRVFRLSEKARL